MSTDRNIFNPKKHSVYSERFVLTFSYSSLFIVLLILLGYFFTKTITKY